MICESEYRKKIISINEEYSKCNANFGKYTYRHAVLNAATT